MSSIVYEQYNECDTHLIQRDPRHSRRRIRVNILHQGTKFLAVLDQRLRYLEWWIFLAVCLHSPLGVVRYPPEYPLDWIEESAIARVNDPERNENEGQD